MEYQRFKDTVIMRLDPGEEILEQLERLARAEQIALAQVSGLGALSDLEICVFDTVAKQFLNNTYHEAMELLSLSGTITQKDGEPYLHIHAAAGRGDGSACGGHLKKAVVSATAEIVVQVIDGVVERKFSEEIGLNLFSFK